MAYAKHENILMAIIREYTSIEDLLDMFFSFLEHKTDYYHLMIDEKDMQWLQDKYEQDPSTLMDIMRNNQCGFKIQDREKALLKMFRKHQMSYVMRKQPFLTEHEELKKKYLPYCSDIIKINTDKDFEKRKAYHFDYNIKHTTNQENHISTWNGGVTDKYLWNQTLSEINLELPFKETIISSEVHVAIGNKEIKVQYMGETKLQGEFYERVNKEDCLWNIEDRKKIIISIEKKRENWWPCVIKGDPEIDTKKIESKKNINEFDEKTQNELRKFLQEQKLKENLHI